MSIQTEQEFKALLTPQAATQLIAAYPFAPAFTQTNRYFDTADHRLQHAHMALRIRQFADHAEQTLKVPTGPHRLLTEFTDPITGTALVPNGVVADQLTAAAIPWQALAQFAEATTTRRLYQLDAGLLTLDHTRYPNGQSDWEVELEYHDAKAAHRFWQALEGQLAIPFAQPTNKIQRALANVKSSQSK